MMTRFALLISFYRLCVIALIGTALLSIGTRVAAETITVCPDGSCDYTDIQSAVFLAVNGDIIDIGPGTYSLPASVATTTPIVKPLGKALRFRGTLGTTGELLTILDGKNVRRAVECTTQETAATVFENLMIRSCPNSAVYISGSSSPTLTNCTITGNAGRGAGIAFANWSTGTSKVINCRITGNNSGGLSGGGVYVEGGTREFVNCQISQNRNANSGAGVMVSGSSSVRFIDCDITNNVISPAGPATNIDGGGAGLFLGGTSAFLDSCLISGNSASVSSSEGGGIDIYFCDTEMRNCEVSQNSAVDGGGLYVWGSPPSTVVVLAACQIKGNSASGFGGGIYTTSASQLLQATASTLCGNSAPIGAQIYGNGWPAGGDNCVNNSCSVCEPPCAGDLNGNGQVDGEDLGALLVAWGTTGTGQPGSDVNGDGSVDGADLGALLVAWGVCP
jgi:predicted outer membrane repeat protein